MAEIDPEKILAELAAARARLREAAPASETNIPLAGKKLIIGTVAIFGMAALALWLLLMFLEQLPHQPKDDQQGPAPTPPQHQR